MNPVSVHAPSACIIYLCALCHQSLSTYLLTRTRLYTHTDVLSAVEDGDEKEKEKKKKKTEEMEEEG